MRPDDQSDDPKATRAHSRLADALAAMPDLGCDADFDRPGDVAWAPDRDGPEPSVGWMRRTR